MSAHRDLADRADPRDLDKPESAAEQAKQGERPASPPGADHAAVSKQPRTGAARPPGTRPGTDPERDRSPFRPRDEGGATPTR